MGLIQLLILLVVLGVGVYLLETYVPLAAPFKVIIRVIVVIFCVLLLLSTFGIVHVPMPKL